MTQIGLIFICGYYTLKSCKLIVCTNHRETVSTLKIKVRCCLEVQCLNVFDTANVVFQLKCTIYPVW